MSEVWEVLPGVGFGPLRFGMARDEVAAFEDVMGPVEEMKDLPLSGGRVALHEFRDIDAPVCCYEHGRLKHIGISESDTIDARFERISIFGDGKEVVYSAIARAADKVFWHINRGIIVIPSLHMELVGFVMEYSREEEPAKFSSSTGGFTWRKVILLAPDSNFYDDLHLIENSIKVKA